MIISFQKVCDFFSSGFVSTILGAAIGYIGSMKGVKNSEKGKNLDEISKKIRILSAMRSEFIFLLERYENVYGQFISNTSEGQPIDEFSPSKEDYFTVYINNSEIIGDISNEKTRESIIRSYILSKSIMEEFEINNSLHEEYRKSFQKSMVLGRLRIYSSAIKEDNAKINKYGNMAISGLLHEIALLKEEREKINSRTLEKFRITILFYLRKYSIFIHNLPM